MNMRKDLWKLTAAAAIILAFVGCKGPGSTAARANGATNSNNPELFTISQDQMSHVTGIDSSTHNADSIPPADGSRSLQQFSHDAGHYAGERTSQSRRRRSRSEGARGRAYVVRGESGLLPAPHKLFEGQGCICSRPDGQRPSARLVPTSRDCRAECRASGIGGDPGRRRSGSRTSRIESHGNY